MTDGRDGAGEAEAAAESEPPDCPDWLEDVAGADAGVIAAIRAREAAAAAGLPERESLLAMEEPLERLTGAAALMRDLAELARAGETPQPRGLAFLAGAMGREAERLYRLYHGRHPLEG